MKLKLNNVLTKCSIQGIYGQLICKNHDIDNLTLDDFKNLFSKRITYIMAFTSHLADDCNVSKNIEKFNSNIARYSLIQCFGEMKAYYYDMLNYQIHRV